MLSTRFIYVISKLLIIVNENKTKYRTRTDDNMSRTLLDNLHSCNFLSKLLDILCIRNDRIKDKLTLNARTDLSNMNSLYYQDLINGGEITDRIKQSTYVIDNFNSDDQNIIIKYLSIYEDDYVFTYYDDEHITKLYFDWLFAPIFFEKKFEGIYKGNNCNYFNKIDTLRGEHKFNDSVYYSDYTRDIEKNANIMQIIQFIKDTKKYSIPKDVPKIDKVIEQNNIKIDVPTTQISNTVTKDDVAKKSKRKKVKIPATLRNSVWNTYVGKSNKQGSCFCCNTEPITTANFECGHIISEYDNGEISLQNLRPICSLCNKSMNTKNMEEFMNKHGFTKNKNWDGIQDTVNKTVNKTVIKTDNITDYITNLNMKQLRQICMLLHIYCGGTKPKLIKKIQDTSINKDELMAKINYTHKFFIKCDGVEQCSECKIINDTVNYCDKCVKSILEKRNLHMYYTDVKLSTECTIINEHIKIRDGKTKCLECKKITYMEEYNNAFYNSD